MRLFFMGTPDFAAASLSKLLEERFEVLGVFTMPDRPRNRGQKVSSSPVKELANGNGIPVYEPSTLLDGEAVGILRAANPEAIAVVAYGRILPKEILDLPRYGCINVHASLLPKYRGAAPIQRAILNGEKITGITTMYMAEGMDTGDMIYKCETEIRESETSGELFTRLAPMGAELLLKTLRSIEAGTAPREPQNGAEATEAPQLKKSESPVDWGKYSAEILNHIAGMQPWPVANAVLGGVEFKIYKAVSSGTEHGRQPGEIIEASPKRGIKVACGGGESIRITELQVSGGKRMRAGDYLLGHPMRADA